MPPGVDVGGKAPSVPSSPAYESDGLRLREKSVEDICDEFERLRSLQNQVRELSEENERLRRQMQAQSKDSWHLQVQIKEILKREALSQANYLQEACSPALSSP